MGGKFGYLDHAATAIQLLTLHNYCRVQQTGMHIRCGSTACCYHLPEGNDVYIHILIPIDTFVLSPLLSLHFCWN
jgi:hypothetical protein